MQPSLRAAGREGAGGIPFGRKMDGDQHRHAEARQITVEVDAVHVHEVDRPAIERTVERAPNPRVYRAAYAIVDGTARNRNADELSDYPRSFLGDDDRAVAGRHQPVVESTQHLFGPANRVPTNRGERKCDIEDGQRTFVGLAGIACEAGRRCREIGIRPHAVQHRCPKPSSASASPARARHRAPVMPHSNCSYHSGPG